MKPNLKKLSHYDMEQFNKDAQAYISATRDNRMFCIIDSVSRSGMSRKLHFHSYEHTGYYRNYFALFVAMGYSKPKNGNAFTVSGCGMDMVFATHYDIISGLKNMGIITPEEFNTLSQKTPTTF
jgi:hypothetical protein